MIYNVTKRIKLVLCSSRPLLKVQIKSIVLCEDTKLMLMPFFLDRQELLYDELSLQEDLLPLFLLEIVLFPNLLLTFSTGNIFDRSHHHRFAFIQFASFEPGSFRKLFNSFCCEFLKINLVLVHHPLNYPEPI